MSQAGNDLTENVVSLHQGRPLTAAERAKAYRARKKLKPKRRHVTKAVTESVTARVTTEPSRRDPAEAVMAMIALREHCRQVAANRQYLERHYAPWRRIGRKLIVLVIIAGIGFVVIAHALAQ